MKIGYFPGCSLHGTAIEYEESLRSVTSAFGIELEEVNDWNCCGATAAHNLNKLLSVALPARILALAELQGFTELLVPCAACFSRLATARHEILSDEALRMKVPDIIEMPYSGSCKPMNVVDFINKYITKELPAKVNKPFYATVACYYGCLLVRPPKLLGLDNFENPKSMEAIVKAMGGKTIDWGFKTECCGAGLSVTRTDIVAKLSGKIIEDASERGAQCIITACPMCHSNLDMRRPESKEYLKKEIDIPVMFITQAIGMSMGMSDSQIGAQRHFTPVKINFSKPEEKPAEKPKKPAKAKEEV